LLLLFDFSQVFLQWLDIGLAILEPLLYPFMFERMTSAEVEKFFRFGEIAFRTE
jgi:hypothetical protein